MFPNIQKVLIYQADQLKKKRVKDLKATIKERGIQNAFTEIWYYRDLAGKGQYTKETVKKVCAGLLKDVEKNLLKDLKKLEMSFPEDKKEINVFNVSVEWKTNRTWGANPRATVRTEGYGNYCSYESKSIGGCGYDKESTAIAEALNQIPLLRYYLYSYLDKQLKKYITPSGKVRKGKTLSNREIFGYGSGYGLMPYFEGGVGVDCYPTIFKKLGYTWKRIATGKTYDVYNAVKDLPTSKKKSI